MSWSDSVNKEYVCFYSSPDHLAKFITLAAHTWYVGNVESRHFISSRKKALTMVNLVKIIDIVFELIRNRGERFMKLDTDDQKRIVLSWVEYLCELIFSDKEPPKGNKPPEPSGGLENFLDKLVMEGISEIVEDLLREDIRQESRSKLYNILNFNSSHTPISILGCFTKKGGDFAEDNDNFLNCKNMIHWGMANSENNRIHGEIVDSNIGGSLKTPILFKESIPASNLYVGGGSKEITGLKGFNSSFS